MFWALACTGLISSALAPPAAGQSIWELTPYRIQLLVVLAPAPELTPRLKADLLGGLLDRADALVGAAWDITCAAGDQVEDVAGDQVEDEDRKLQREKLQRTLSLAINTANVELIPKESLEFDKLMLLTVSPAGVGYRVTAREFDVRTRLFGAPVSMPVRQLGKLRDAALDAMLEAFAPLARIERVEDRQIRAQVLLAMAPLRELTPRLQADLLRDLAGRHREPFSEPWELTPVAAPPKLQPAMISGMEAVTTESLPRESLRFDKVMLLAVSRGQDGFEITARELDVHGRQWDAAFPAPVEELDKLRAAALDAMYDASSPLPEIERVEKKEVVLQVKAAALPPRDRQLLMVRPGDVFRPVIRRNDREGNLRKDRAGKVMMPAPIPWTFLTVRAITPRELACRLHSGYRNPVSGRRRARVEQLALAVVPPRKPSTLILQSRRKPNEPGKPDQPNPLLAGYQVYAHPPDSKTTMLLGRTNRQGRLVVPPAENPLRMLLVRSGGEPLARLPMVPGLEPELTAVIANDDQRLAAEGFITALQEQLVDLVTRRKALIARADARIDAGRSDAEQKKFDEARKKFDEADILMDELQQLQKSQSDLTDMLAGGRKRIRSPDSLVQRKIDVLFRDSGKLLEEHLDAESVKAVEQRLRNARKQAGA